MATILVIDDDADLIEACGLAITQRGHQVQAAHSAQEARQVLRSARPDALVLDVMMETTSAGFELARDVRRQFPDLPIIMLTSVHQAVPPSLHFEPEETWLPVTKFLDKPVDPAALADAIDKMLAGRGDAKVPPIQRPDAGS
jgi:two-component system alkaline phosphatase synthesis response regulator PhoP